VDLADLAVLASQWLTDGTSGIEITVEVLGVEPVNDGYLASLRVCISDPVGNLIGGSLEIDGPIDTDVFPLTVGFCDDLPGDSPCELQASSLVFEMAYFLPGEDASWNLTFTITNSVCHTVSKTISIPKESVPEDMVLIPAGTFQMGDSFNEGYSGERPVHTVTLSSFYMSRCEITNGQYRDFLNGASHQIKVVNGVVYALSDGSNSYPYCNTHDLGVNSQIDYGGGVFSVRTKGGRSMVNDPMVEVSWYGAVAYCNWRSQQEGRQPCYNLSTWTCDFSKNGYHLPTEAQWEYAARGGLSGKRFPWGNTITHSQANYYSDSSDSYDISPTRGYHPAWDDVRPYTCPVDSFSPNGYGLHNMAGNVWEWCNDWSGGYSSNSQTNPTGPSSGTNRVLRGGCWYYYLALDCRVAIRYGFEPNYRLTHSGFRVSLDF